MKPSVTNTSQMRAYPAPKQSLKNGHCPKCGQEIIIIGSQSCSKCGRIA